ncbi:MAG: VCBS repeat-containing protein [Planctomycetes bacterium]|nr:VCBS repeat-containing protein [Planctomycetota bacterium]
MTTRCISACILTVGVLAVFAAILLPAADDAGRDVFVDDRFEDFAAGKLDAGGQNLYVSRDGKVRTINRFDLNGDGHIDLLFNSTHDTYQMLPATAGLVAKDRGTRSLDIAVEGSQRVVLGDLNRDGYTDAVFCPNGIGVDHLRRFVSIAWGGADGWAAQRVTSVLPINGATAVALADLNHDGWPDIVVLGGDRWMLEQPEGRIVRIFWGSATGYSVAEFQDLGVAGAVDLAAGDFDGDGASDLAVLRSDGQVTIFWATRAKATPLALERSEVALPGKDGTCLVSADVNGDGRPDLIAGTTQKAVYLVAAQAGRRWARAASVPAFPATHVAVGDLDRDGHADLVLTYFTQAHAAGGEQAGAGKDALGLVRILWGSRNGFSERQATTLKASHAVAAAVGDLDGDGHADLVVAIHQGAKTFNGESAVFFGDGRRHFTRGKAGFRTSGTTDVVVAPAEKDLPARVIFCNSIGGQLDEDVPVLVYWGGKGGFDPQRVWKIPFHSGYEGSAADLNADGYVDLILLNSGHAGESAHEDKTLGANIFWGGPKGFDLEKRRTVLHEHYLGTSTVADLNRDGYLDLVLEPFAPEKPGEVDQLIIYYGGPGGFNKSRRVSIPKEGYGQEHVVADVNDDGWLDIITTSRQLNCVRIFWGGPQGFDPKREQRLKVSGPVGVSAADLNGDGYLDLVVSSYNDPVSRHRDMGLTIFWGSATGYRHSNAQTLPGFSPLGRCIADFDGDGYLDIFSPQHSGELTREDLACHIYWGGKEGFSRSRRTTLFCDSVNAALAADFDGDGRLDLAVACHTRHGDHRAQSRVFYNDGKRFENPRLQKLPAPGPHLMWSTEMGNLYDRKYRHTFESRVFHYQRPVQGGSLRSKAEAAAGATLTFEIRSAATRNALPAQKWRPVQDRTFPLVAQDRCLQYRAVFRSTNGDRYPILDRVEIELRR